MSTLHSADVVVAKDLLEKSVHDGGFAEYFNGKLDIADEELRLGTVLLMRNTAGLYTAEQGETVQTNLMPIIRAAYPNNVLHEIASVQPCSKSVATIRVPYDDRPYTPVMCVVRQVDSSVMFDRLNSHDATAEEVAQLAYDVNDCSAFAGARLLYDATPYEDVIITGRTLVEALRKVRAASWAVVDTKAADYLDRLSNSVYSKTEPILGPLGITPRVRRVGVLLGSITVYLCDCVDAANDYGMILVGRKGEDLVWAPRYVIGRIAPRDLTNVSSGLRFTISQAFKVGPRRNTVKLALNV